jgi:hypothetical protein
MKKLYTTQENIGAVKYVVNHHDGVKQHKDGSAFYDINTFTAKRLFKAFIKRLEKQGYKERGFCLT